LDLRETPLSPTTTSLREPVSAQPLQVIHTPAGEHLPSVSWPSIAGTGIRGDTAERVRPDPRPNLNRDTVHKLLPKPLRGPICERNAAVIGDLWWYELLQPRLLLIHLTDQAVAGPNTLIQDVPIRSARRAQPDRFSAAPVSLTHYRIRRASLRLKRVSPAFTLALR
jgi:hypothetical protein